MSTEAIAKTLGMELVEIKDWNCCGASAAHNQNHLLSLALPARNLALAEEQGLTDIAVPCAACFQRLKAAEVAVKESDEVRQEVTEVIERNIEGTAKTRSLLEVIYSDFGAEAVSAKVVKKLEGLKVACYYGCLLTRPTKLGIDSPENPMMMDKLMEAAGATAVAWPYKTECCGAGNVMTRPQTGIPMTAQVVKYAKLAGADCIVTACPLCMANLDMRQKAAESVVGMQLGLPVYYFTELLGVAFGLPMSSLGLDKHIIEATGLLNNLAATRSA